MDVKIRMTLVKMLSFKGGNIKYRVGYCKATVKRICVSGALMDVTVRQRLKCKKKLAPDVGYSKYAKVKRLPGCC